MDETQSGSGHGSSPDAEVAPDQRLESGQWVDQYLVKKEIGAGGMGRVYLARDQILGRWVALKVVRTDRVPPEKMAALRNEARIIALFNHPHIVTVYGTGEINGAPYLALEYLEGTSLRARMAERPFSPKEIYRVSLALAKALRAAHGVGVVHADLKPENVFICADGRTRVLDFGLASVDGEVRGVAGTPAYLAPERWSTSAPAPPSDIWALGATMFEMMERRRPVVPYGPLQDLSAYRPDVFVTDHPEPLQYLVRSCLDGDPQKRPTAEKLVEQLEVLVATTRPSTDARPFRGLATFKEHEAAFYFGREADIGRAVEELRTQPILPLVGPSGAGKSSFVQAGLIPRLREIEPWEIIQLRPGSRPLSALASRLAQLDPARPEVSGDELDAQPGLLGQVLENYAVHRHIQVLLFVDQMEEVFTLDPQGNQTEAFLRVLGCTDDPTSRVRICFTVREDFVGRLANYESFRRALSHMMVLLPMDEAQLTSTIEAPLALAGYRFERPDRVKEMVAELVHHRAALPLLQFALDQIWDQRDQAHRFLPERAFEAVGGVVGALAHHAEQVIQSLLPEDQRRAQALLMLLVTADGLRRPRSRTELLERIPAPQVLERLLRERLLVTRTLASGNETVLIELAHEALVTAWPTFAGWRSAEQAEAALLQDIESAAEFWHRRNRDKSATWTGETLAEIEKRLIANPIVLPELAKKFLESSRQLNRQAIRRRRRIFWGGLTLSLLVTAITSVAAWFFYQKEQETQRQQQELNTAGADIGIFILKIRIFDWDEATQKARPISSGLEALKWQLFRPENLNRRMPGLPFSASQVRLISTQIEGEVRSDLVEASGGPAFIEFSDRGGDCGTSLIPLQALPGYSRRSSNPVTLELVVPSCQASSVNMIKIEEGPFIYGGPGVPPLSDSILDEETLELSAYYIDAVEVSNSAYLIFAQMAALTGEPIPTYPSIEYQHQSLPEAPVTGLNAFEAETYCRYLGKRLPRDEEWLKAGRGGLTVGDRPNPAPRRNYPSGRDTYQDVRKVMAVGSNLEDISPYGVHDLSGNVSEWTASPARLSGFEGLRATRGGTWLPDAPEALFMLGTINARDPRFEDYSIGVRCAKDP